jgi:hypothetical protein
MIYGCYQLSLVNFDHLEVLITVKSIQMTLVANDNQQQLN